MSQEKKLFTLENRILNIDNYDLNSSEKIALTIIADANNSLACSDFLRSEIHSLSNLTDDRQIPDIVEKYHAELHSTCQ